MKTIINHKEYTFDIHPTDVAVDLIRNQAGLTGTKFVCGVGVCGGREGYHAYYVAVGAVGPVPLRLPHVEAVLAGEALTDKVVGKAAAMAIEGVNPLPQTGYKVPLLVYSIEEALLLARNL